MKEYERRFPLVKLAKQEFVRTFSDLLSVRATVSIFEKSLIEGVYGQIMWFGRTKRDHQNFERTARAAYSFLEQGSRTKHRFIAEQVMAVCGEIAPALNRCIGDLNDIKQVKEDDIDTQVEKYLEYYKTMYEALIPYICAPVALAFSVTKHINISKNKKFMVYGDGKINLKSLEEMEKWFEYPENRLRIGLNSHVRNAYSHERYKILDNSKVELWDINPRNGELSWGPEVWSLDDLIKLCDELWINALGITCALILYIVNNRKLIESRGWSKALQPPKLRHHELEASINTVSADLGLHLENISVEPENVTLGLTTSLKGIDQDEELLLGYVDGTKRYKIPVRYEPRRIVDQLVILLHRLVPYFTADKKVSIHVSSPEGSTLGTLVTDLNTIIGLQLTDAEPQTTNRIRHIFEQDTLGDNETYIKIEGEPREDYS